MRFVTNVSDTLPGMPAQLPARPPVVVDIDLDAIDAVAFTPYTFRKSVGDRSAVFTLKLEQDHLLAQFAETARGGDVYELYCSFIEQTASTARYDDDGSDVDVVAFLTERGVDVERYAKQIEPDPETGVRRDVGVADVLLHMLYEREITLKVISHLAQSAIAQWSDELTDPSMRPERLSRRERRARR